MLRSPVGHARLLARTAGSTLSGLEESRYVLRARIILADANIFERPPGFNAAAKIRDYRENPAIETWEGSLPSRPKVRKGREPKFKLRHYPSSAELQMLHPGLDRRDAEPGKPLQ